MGVVSVSRVAGLRSRLAGEAQAAIVSPTRTSSVMLRAAMDDVRAELLAAADDRRLAPPVEAIVPVAPTEHQRPHDFGRRHHHLVPGTVTINGAAYICHLDGQAPRRP